MKVIGYKRSDFTASDGTKVTGYSIYLAYPLHGDDADGQAVDRYYLSDARLERCSYTPHVGDEVAVTFNRQGKIAGIFAAA